MVQLVETLQYKPEDRGFDSQWCQKFFVVVLESTQPVVLKSGSLSILEPPGPLQGLLYLIYIYIYIYICIYITLPYIYIYIYIYINITLPCIYIYIYMYKEKYYMRVCVVGYKLQTVIGKVSLILNSSTKMTKKNDDDVNYKNNSSNRNSKSPC